MSKPAAAAEFSRLGRLARGVLALAGAAMLTAGVLLQTVHVPATNWRLDAPWALAAGGLTLAAVWALRQRSAHAALALACFVLPAALFFAIGHRPPQRGDVSAPWLGGTPHRTWVTPDEWFQNYTDCDDRYGYRNRPRAVARHHHRDFDVVYRTDDRGWRVMPQPREQNDLTEIALVGCSFTFGFGVPEGEYYGALLAGRAWAHRPVGNYSAVGWGTAHAALMVEELLQRTTPPACILYGWLTKHHMRNYRRRTIHESAVCGFPLFEPDGQQVRFAGLMPVAGNTWEDSPELVDVERQVSVALLERMQRACNERGVPFYVLALEREDDSVLDEVIRRGTVGVIDLSWVSGLYFPHDEHPAPLWHRQIARAMARLDVLAERVGDSRLKQPDAITAVDEAWSLSLFLDRGGDARLVRSAEAPTVIRVEPCGKPGAGGVELQRRVSLAAGKKYRLELRLRADRERDALIVAGQAHPPWETVGANPQVRLDNTWRDVQVDYEPAQDFPRAKLAILFQQDDTPLEVTATHLWCDDRDLLAEDPGVPVHEPNRPQPAADEQADER